MDKKCSNCGQFITEQDRYCKYCGAPNAAFCEPEQQAPKKSLSQLEDERERKKVELDEADYEGAGILDPEKISLQKKGAIDELTSKNRRGLILFPVMSIVALISTLLTQFFWVTENYFFKFAVMLFLMLIFCYCIAMSFQKLDQHKLFSSLMSEKDSVFVARGLKATPYLKKGTEIFEIVLENKCPICHGEIIGDLHIEKIENRVIAVCNMNRKHFYIVDVKTLLDKVNI